MNESNQMIGAVLPRDRAASAGSALDSAGLADHDVVPAADSGPQTVGRRLGGGLLRGAGVGAVALALGMMLLAALTSPAEGRAVTMMFGAAAGAIAGAFIGGYLGLSRHRRRLWYQRDFEQVDIGPDEVLIVVDTPSDPVEAERILVQHGGRPVHPAHPDD